MSDMPNEAEFHEETFEQPDLIEQQDIDNAQAEVDAAQEQVEQASGDERVDWKAQAIQAQTRLEMLEEMRQQQYAQQPAAPQVDEVTQLRQQIQEKRQSMPELDDKNPQTFWERERIKEEVDQLQEQLVEARIRTQERALAEQHTSTVVQQYKTRFANSARFRAIETQFNNAVSQLEPHLRGNQTMLDMIRKNLEYDVMAKQGSQPKAPPAAPSQGYNSGAVGRQPQRGVQWRNAEDQAVGEYYMSRGIINSPEEFYDPRFNENSPTANNNGVAIYDIPQTKKGWRK